MMFSRLFLEKINSKYHHHYQEWPCKILIYCFATWFEEFAKHFKNARIISNLFDTVH